MEQNTMVNKESSLNKKNYPYLDKLITYNSYFELLADKVESLQDVKFTYMYECLKKIRIYHGKLLAEQIKLCQHVLNSNLSEKEKEVCYFDISMYDDIIDICKKMVIKCEKKLEETIFKLSKLLPVQNKQTGGSTLKPILINFFADWCGACKQFKPVWKQLVDKYKGKNIDMQAIECGNDESLLTKYSVHAFPTVRLYTMKGGKTQINEYREARTIDSLSKWIDSNV
jgi:thiol-disulfide isomerase/thioredoxin